MAKAKQKPLKGRPPIAEEERRGTLIKVLVTKEEDEQLRQAARAAKQTVSSWVRAVALERAQKVV